MVVLISNATGTVRRRQEGSKTPWGERTKEDWAEPAGDPLPAYVSQGADSAWTIGVDSSLWPVSQGDLVVVDGREFVVQTADLRQNAADPTVDYVSISALEHTAAGTRPPDTWFPGR